MLSIDIIRTTHEDTYEDGELWEGDALSTYTDTHTYAAHLADAIEQAFEPARPAAWVASVLGDAYCNEPSEGPRVTHRAWFSAESYSHPYSAQREEVSAHISGDEYTDAMASEVAAIIAAR